MVRGGESAMAERGRRRSGRTSRDDDDAPDSLVRADGGGAPARRKDDRKPAAASVVDLDTDDDGGCASPDDGRDDGVSPSAGDSPGVASTAAAGRRVAVATPRVGRPPPSPYAGYSRGNLVQLRMKDFMSFSDTILRPGPRLNLILGPNGTGKSSIVSAVCLCFGGSLSLLGRAQEVGAYVRHAKLKASVEAWIYDDRASGGVRRICRQFDPDGASTYFIDGARVKKGEIDNLNKRYDVQLDNLSQFMPQEKIADFVAQKPKELLMTTVRALGGSSKRDALEQLILEDSRQHLERQALEQRKTQLATLHRENKALVAEVNSFYELQRMKETVRAMERFLPWAYHRDAQEAFKELKDAQKEQEDVLNAKRQEAAALRGPLAEIEQRLGLAKQAYSATKRVVREKDEAATQLVDEMDEHANEIDKISAELAQVDKIAARHAKEIETAETRLSEEKAKLEEALKHGTDDRDNAVIKSSAESRLASRREAQDAVARRSDLQATQRAISREMHNLEAKRASLQDPKMLRIRELEKNPQHRGAGACANWIRDNAQLFRGRVYGPIAVEVDCDSEYHARIIKNAIAGWCMGSFVVECKEDQDTLRREAPRALGGYKPNVFTPPLNRDGWFDRSEAFHPDRPVDDRLRSLGIYASVTDVFNAEDAVKAALNAQFQFHRMHVGDQRSDNKEYMEELQREIGLSIWYTPATRCQVRRSRYDQNSVSTVVDDLPNDCGVFAGRMDDVEREHQQIELHLRQEEEKLREVQIQIENVRKEIEQLASDDAVFTETSRAAQERISSRRKLSQFIENAKRRLETLSSSRAVKNAENEKERLRALLSKREAKCLPLALGVSESLQAAVAAIAEFDIRTAQVSGIVRELRHEKQKHEESTHELTKLEETLAAHKAQVSDARRELKRCQQAAEKSLPRAEYLENEERYAEFPLVVEELEAKIRVMKDECAQVTNGGRGAVQEYERQLKLIEKLEADIATEEQNANARKTNFEARKTAFLEWLSACVDRMKRRFSRLYALMGCRGDIQLINLASDRIADLEIQILASYREEQELRAISSSGNSGGEKMACTMLYCFALQEEEQSPPFVMVDELNQGLDPDRERFIMRVMLENAEGDEAGQSFVVTPKLLLNLPVRRNVATHVIMNGHVACPIISPQC